MAQRDCTNLTQDCTNHATRPISFQILFLVSFSLLRKKDIVMNSSTISGEPWDIRRFDLNAHAEAKAALTAPVKPGKPRYRQHQKTWFLRGPIPGPWVTQAMSLSLGAVRVGLAAWHVAACTKSLTVTLSGLTLERFSIVRVDPGLRELERAGLVTVDRHRGRRPEITIAEAQP